jgi:hypothetical protein
MLAKEETRKKILEQANKLRRRRPFFNLYSIIETVLCAWLAMLHMCSERI